MDATTLDKTVNATIRNHGVSHATEHCSQTALKNLFELFFEIYSNLDVRAGSRDYLVLQIEKENLSYLHQLRHIIEKEYPLVVHSVFEDNGQIKEIKADVWREELLGRHEHANGVVKMNVAAHCNKLPLHVHPFSGRILLIIEGHGIGHYSSDDPETATPENIKSTPIREGSLIFFKENVLHTVSTTTDSLTTLTYHYPFYEFDDEKSFEKLLNWYPPLISPKVGAVG